MSSYAKRVLDVYTAEKKVELQKPPLSGTIDEKWCNPKKLQFNSNCFNN